MIVSPSIPDEIVPCFASLLAEAGRRHPDKPAIVTSDEILHWGEFANQIARATGRLQQEGIQQGDKVATLGQPTAQHVTAICAILAAGACVVPLPVTASDETLSLMLRDSDARLVFAAPDQRERAFGTVRTVDLLRLEDWIAEAPPVAPVDISPEDLFNIVYSSGTTGTPKGIVHDYRFRMRQISRIRAFGMDEKGRMLLSTPLYSNTTLFGLLPALALGATVIVMPRFDTVSFLELAQEHAVTHAVLVPVQYRRLMADPSFDRFDLSSFHCKFSTSSPLGAALIAEVMKRWPGNLIEVYGMTEGGVSTILDCGKYPEKWHTVGMPGANVEIKVINDEGHEQPRGAHGELVGRAITMMRHYNNQPDLTAEIVWTDPNGRHFLRSGDIGRFDDDGFVELTDRKKDMIISGGFNIYATDLEAVLLRHPEVTEAAVIAVASAEWGETPVGYVVLRPGSSAQASEILDFANAELGRTQRLYKVLVVEDFPRNDIGKILKRELRVASTDST